MNDLLPCPFCGVRMIPAPGFENTACVADPEHDHDCPLTDWKHRVRFWPVQGWNRRATPPAATPDMQAIMAGNGHPDEGPCVVCGHVFDAHLPGCVFDRASTGTEGLRAKLNDILAALAPVYRSDIIEEILAVTLTEGEKR